jgi:NAD(P)-dependent dehydrogenase (short-subunit alcohol dehydrogenase family)
MKERKIKLGLRVLVTAGASGIGHAIAKAFAEDGARVHICDLNDDLLAQTRDELGVSVSHADVSNEQDVKALLSYVEQTFGGLDVLVNNAGIAGPTGAVDEISSEDWRRTIDINLNGHFYCAHYAVPLLRQAGSAAIINLSSAAGRFGYAFRSPYSASKWAIIGFTQSLAKELGPSGIRVNAILPGIVEGTRMDGVIKARADQVGVSFDEMREEYLERVSLRKMVTPDDIASTALFLCSSAGSNISGQSLSVCGNVESL